MTIARRSYKVIPDKLPLEPDYTILSQPNYNQEVFDVNFMFAYRRTLGADRRVRILPVRGLAGLDNAFYIPTTGKKHETVKPGSELNLNLSPSTMSYSLREHLTQEFMTGNQVFNEGQSYTFNSYAFDILSTEEMDAIASSLFFYERNHKVDSFKY